MYHLDTILAALLCFFALTGCGTTTRADSAEQQDRVLVRETTEVRQEVVGGQILELRTKTRVVEQEQTDREASRNETVEVDAPKILDGLKAGATAVATAAMGPAAGQAVSYLWETVAGLGLAGATGGAGLVMRERQRRQEEREMRRKLILAQEAYARDLEDAETDDDVDRTKKKHAARQQALGIHDQLTRERHGA